MNLPVRPSELDDGVVERLLDVNDLLEISASGIFEETENVELIDGRLMVAPSEGSAHFGVGGALNEMLTDLARRVGDVRYYVNATLQLTTRRVLNPDGLILAKGSLHPPALPGPEDVKLVVEVADTTIRYDEGRKRQLYAEAGVRELWIVRVPQGDVRVLRDPRDGMFMDERLARPGETLSPLFAPHEILLVAGMFEI